MALSYEKKEDYDEAWKYIGLARKYNTGNEEIFEKFKQLRQTFNKD